MTFAESGNTLTVNQTSSKLILDWNSFSIAAGEVTNFVQPTGGAALNRVITANPSQILGQLNATGKVILINPNGILVGPTGQIDTRALLHRPWM